MDLEQLTARIRARGGGLTPGAVAAHAVGRALALRHRAKVERGDREAAVARLFQDIAKAVFPDSRERDDIWVSLRRSGWLARLLSIPHAEKLLRNAVDVLARLPPAGSRVDRRHLASEVTGDPHALDHGKVLAGVVLRVLVAAGRVQAGVPIRAAWAAAGVDCDDVTGGLVTVGIVPLHWTVPRGAVAILPPRVLNDCEWPPPAGDQWVFATENPSIASAAADLAASGPDIRLVCTNGTPAGSVLRALARLASAGWRFAVRADFDAAGLSHVRAMLRAVPGALPWRMNEQDYMECLAGSPAALAEAEPFDGLPEASWDSKLAATMRREQRAGYEEALWPRLMEDLKRGLPNGQCG